MGRTENYSGLTLEQFVRNKSQEWLLGKPNAVYWLAGLLEAGGGLYFHNNPQLISNRVVNFTSPVVDYSDDDKEKVLRMVEVYGGGHEPRNPGSYMWSLKRLADSIPLILSIERYAPYRSYFAGILKEWLEADSTDLRVEIAKRSKAGWEISLSPDVYKSLLVLPGFLAGVIDGRGVLYHTINERSLPQLRIHSKNKALLDAIGAKYDLKPYVNDKSGEEVSINKVRRMVKRDGYTLSFNPQKTQGLLEEAKDFLIAGRVKAV